jgi:hypothetical protein
MQQCAIEMPAQILRVDALFLSPPHAKRHAGAHAGRCWLDPKVNAAHCLVRGLDLAICSHGPANEASAAANCFTYTTLPKASHGELLDKRQVELILKEQ